MPKDEPKKTKSGLKKYTIILLGLFLLGLTLFILRSNYVFAPQSEIEKISINQTQLNVELAQSENQKSKGLCCRDSLEPNQGMLFIYNKAGDYRFWMKDTRIPLDIIWIDSEKRVVHIEDNVQPSSYPKSFGSAYPAQYVIETNANWTKEHNVKVGDSVSF